MRPRNRWGVGFGFGDVALENVVSEGEAALVKCHADGHMAAVVALLFIFAVAGFWVLGAESSEMGVGHVVEDDATLAVKELRLTMTDFW